MLKSKSLIQIQKFSKSTKLAYLSARSLSTKQINPKLLYKNNLKLFCSNTNSSANSRVHAVYFGNEDISLPTLKMLHKRIYVKDNNTKDNLDISEIEVVSTPWVNNNKKQAPFHSFIMDKQIKINELRNDDWNPIINSLKEKKSLIGFVLSFGKMIPDTIIDTFNSQFNLGIYVIHPSLLPKYRGGAPIQHALLNKDSETGVSLISTSKGKFDSGEIYLQRKVPIEPYHRFIDMVSILGNEASIITEEFIKNYKLIKAKPFEVDSSIKPSKAKIHKDKIFVYLDFTSTSREDIRTVYNAFYGSQLTPWSYVKYGNHKKIIFFDNLFNANPSVSAVFDNDPNVKKYVKPGSIYWDFKLDKDNLYIKTLDSWLISSKIKIECFPTYDTDMFVKQVFRQQKLDKIAKTTFATILNKKDI